MTDEEIAPDVAGAAGPDPGTASAGDPEPGSAALDPGRYHLRRAPRFRAFGITGALVGIVLGAVLARTPVAGEQYTGRAVFGYLALILGLLGIAIGLGAAVLLDRRR